MSGKNQVAFIKPEEPSFLKQFKKRAGYKEGPTIDDKRKPEPGPEGELDGSDERVDEKPTVVTLRPGDLTQEEADALEATVKNVAVEPERNAEDDAIDLLKKKTAVSDDSEFASPYESDKGLQAKKVTFRKPGKRPAGNPDSAQGSRSGQDAKKPKQASSMDQVKNRSLLSFGEDEED